MQYIRYFRNGVVNLIFFSKEICSWTYGIKMLFSKPTKLVHTSRRKLSSCTNEAAASTNWCLSSWWAAVPSGCVSMAFNKSTKLCLARTVHWLSSRCPSSCSMARRLSVSSGTYRSMFVLATFKKFSEVRHKCSLQSGKLHFFLCLDSLHKPLSDARNV